MHSNLIIFGFEINPKYGGKFSEVLTAEEWRKFTHAMSTGLDSGLRINDNSILVECEENSKYQYKLVIYDNTFDDNPLEKVYAIGNIDYNKTDGNKIANFIIKLEENNYDSKKVFRQLLRDYTKQFKLILGQYKIKSKQFNDIGRNSVKNGRVNEGHSNGTRTNQEIGQELSAGVKEKFSLDEDYDFTDEKAGAIHDTLNFSIDEEYDDWLVNDDGKNNINDLIKEAVALETTREIGFYYLDKKRTQSIFKRTGYQLPRTLNNLSSNVIIRTIDDNVNRKINNITQSQQFKRWFGDWQNKPQNASKAVDGNGEPLVLNHQTEKEFTTYVSIKNPLIVNNRSELVNFYDKNVQGYTKAKSSIDTVRENITEQTEVKNGEKIDVEKFSIADDIVDDNGTHYGKGVVLDTKIFKNKKPRDWGKILKKFVYDNLAGKQITVFDENNNERVIEFARLNERVKKDGANNPHKVIDKLARKTDNNSRLAVAHSAEIVEVSNFESNNPTHTHQWLDENGWEYRNVYLINRKGEIYKATLNIGKSKDGRNILYDINKISNIGHGVVFSNGVEKIDTKRNSLINPNVAKTNVSQNIKNVNEKFSVDEDIDEKG